MPLNYSSYCAQNPYEFNCILDPQYNGTGIPGFINPTIQPPREPVGGGGGYTPGPMPVYTTPPYNSGGGNIPLGTLNQGGYQVQGTTLDRIIQGILSGMATIYNRPYVPSQVQPVQPGYGYVAGQGQYAAGQYAGGTYTGTPGTNFGGQFQAFVERNKGAMMIGGALLLVYVATKGRSRARAY